MQNKVDKKALKGMITRITNAEVRFLTLLNFLQTKINKNHDNTI